MLKNEEIDELVIERLNQIYKKLSESKEIKKIKEEENFVGRKLEKVLNNFQILKIISYAITITIIAQQYLFKKKKLLKRSFKSLFYEQVATNVLAS